jgi:hypothetical protein
MATLSLNNNESKECDVCCEPFTKSTRSKVKCCHCDLEACKQCVRTYLMDTTSTPHCMGCKNTWEREFTQKMLNKSFYTGDYRKRRKELLFEGEKARFPETMPHVENYKNIVNWEEEKKNYQKSLEELTVVWNEIRLKISKCTTKITNARAGNIIKDARQFIKKCPVDDCEGFLSSAWKCGVCSIWVCPKCFEIKGHDKNVEHECNPDDVASAELIKQETRPCPSCGIRIYKIEGCDQMWCTGCHVAFSWRTGLRVNGTIHNPHFYQFQRQGGGAVIQNPGAQICGGLPTYYQMRDRVHYIESDCESFRKNIRIIEEKQASNNKFDFIKKYAPNTAAVGQINRFGTLWGCIKQSIYNIHRGAIHFQETVLNRLRADCQNAVDNQSLRIKFICSEITEEHMKTNLLKRDNSREKKQMILHIYELLGTVYTEVMVDIYNKGVNYINTPRESKHEQTLTTLLDDINNNILKLDKVRIYCNVELCKVSCIYNQSVQIINDLFETPGMNKKICAEELKKTENIGAFTVIMRKHQPPPSRNRVRPWIWEAAPPKGQEFPDYRKRAYH